jgi:hypothetical protein
MAKDSIQRLYGISSPTRNNWKYGRKTKKRCVSFLIPFIYIFVYLAMTNKTYESHYLKFIAMTIDASIQITSEPVLYTPLCIIIMLWCLTLYFVSLQNLTVESVSPFQIMVMPTHAEFNDYAPRHIISVTRRPLLCQRGRVQCHLFQKGAHYPSDPIQFPIRHGKGRTHQWDRQHSYPSQQSPRAKWKSMKWFSSSKPPVPNTNKE